MRKVRNSPLGNQLVQWPNSKLKSPKLLILSLSLLKSSLDIPEYIPKEGAILIRSVDWPSYDIKNTNFARILVREKTGISEIKEILNNTLTDNLSRMTHWPGISRPGI